MKTKKEKKKGQNRTQKLSLIKSTPHPRPVIGILTVPVPENKQSHSHSYLPSSCVKWVETGGARVIPIQYGLPVNVIISMLEQCNAL